MLVDRDAWQPARLIPVAGIRGEEEQEARATSAFLAVIRAVPAFAHALLGELGAPRGRVETFTEVRFTDVEGRPHRPDGAIVVTRGSRTWCALMEVKTGAGVLATDQVHRYLDVARENELSAVITVSNEITARPADVPFNFDRRKTRRVGLFHLSWWKILTTAVMEHRHRGVSDPDQAWILGELIAYLDHENSGASGFHDMGRGWVSVRDAARQGTLRANDPGARDVVERWEQFLDYVALGLSQDLGRDVSPVRPRKQSLAERSDAHLRRLGSDCVLGGEMRVPDAAGTITVEANLKAQQVTVATRLDAPREGRQSTRVSWLLKQVPDATPALRLTAAYAGTRETGSALLREAREDPGRLLSPTDPKRDIRSFEIAMTRPLAGKNGRGKGSFVRDTRQQVIDFYSEVAQNLTPWQPRAPRLPEPPNEVPETPRPEPPPFIAASEREAGEGRLDDAEADVDPSSPVASPNRWAATEGNELRG